MVRDINTLKGWYQTLDKPGQDQFWDWLDSYRHKNDAISIADVQNLQNTLNALLPLATYNLSEGGERIDCNADTQYVIPAGYLLEGIILNYGTGGTVKVSLVQFGDQDKLPEEPIDAGVRQLILLNILASVDTTVYISGVPAGSKITFLKRKINI